MPLEELRADWPAAGTADTDLVSVVPHRSGGARVTAATSEDAGAEVTVLGRDVAEAAGVQGVLLTVEPDAGDGAGPVDVALDYSSFAGAFGGGFGSRLTFYELPACVLDSPGEASCGELTPVQAVNDTKTQTLTASGVTPSATQPVVLAAVADEESVESDYTATELSASSTWDVGLNTGDLTWSYELVT